MMNATSPTSLRASGTPSETEPRRNARHRSNRVAIMEAAIGALNANAGATMSEIAARAGVGRATLHRHFSTRNDLVLAIGAQCVEEMKAAVLAVDAVNAPPAQRLRAMFEAVIPLGDRYNFLGFESADDEATRAGYQAQLRWAAALVEDLKVAKDIAPDVPSRWVVGQIDQLVWAAWNAVADGYLDVPEAAGLALRTLLNGLQRPIAGCPK